MTSINYVDLINKLVEALLKAQLGIPIIFDVIGDVIESIRNAMGGGPTPAEQADIIEAKVKERNEPALVAEITRLRNKLGLPPAAA